MLKNIFHAILIVLIAGLIAVGWYVFSLTSASQSLLPDMGEDLPAATSAAQTDVSSSAAVAPSAATPVYDAEAGIFSAQTWLGFLKRAVLLAAITVAVLSVRKVMALVKNWQRCRAAKLTASSTGRDQNWSDRREFLRLGGLVLASGALAMVYKNVVGSSYATASSSDLNTQTKIANLPSTPQQRCVACPKGLTNDPYPGQCHLYLDNDNDGFCDYSVATACANISAENSIPAGNNVPSEEVSPGWSSTPQQRCVACPKGLTNDPYPGQCHLYLDNDNDGFCDYSVATATCNSISGEPRLYAGNYRSQGHLDSGRQGRKNDRQGHGNGRH